MCILCQTSSQFNSKNFRVFSKRLTSTFSTIVFPHLRLLQKKWCFDDAQTAPALVIIHYRTARVCSSTALSTSFRRQYQKLSQAMRHARTFSYDRHPARYLIQVPTERFNFSYPSSITNFTYTGETPSQPQPAAARINNHNPRLHQLSSSTPQR